MRGGAKCRQTTTKEDGMVCGGKSQRPHRGDDAPSESRAGRPPKGKVRRRRRGPNLGRSIAGELPDRSFFSSSFPL
ncbi:hypothetical protein DY000_02005122 [Brassica cretica]|uniref:Uncharacterized protein n=1 Tax=Brassica cretica TaxID=69181 RepID=A0ABQ7C6L9_BRACR|nr:hypothetical protein DY000_02005122 [Brassica cretica]